MYSEEVLEPLTFHLHNLAFQRFEEERSYKKIISPFCRIYLPSAGSGLLLTGKEKIVLESGYLYIIPGFSFCSYHFNPGLSQYYIHVSIGHAGGIDPFTMLRINNKAEATELDYRLFERLAQINPDRQLPHDNPQVYQTKHWLGRKVSYETPGQHLETIAILAQIFSRFISQNPGPHLNILVKYNIQMILQYIQAHLDRNIPVDDLADMSCLSRDHFSRVFKSITGFSPGDFIIRKRIEKAQFLLLTTELGQKEIIEMTGFKSASYFSRMFRKQTSYSPGKYRNQQS